jgi:hypothetical protein
MGFRAKKNEKWGVSAVIIKKKSGVGSYFSN